MELRGSADASHGPTQEPVRHQSSIASATCSGKRRKPKRGTAAFRAQRAHAAHAGSVPRRFWLLDSGANCVVVPEGDPDILRVIRSSGPVSLQTSAGKVQVVQCLVRTPLGCLPGLISPGSPRLLPMGLLRKRGFFSWGRGKPRAGFGGRALEVVVHDDLPHVAVAASASQKSKPDLPVPSQVAAGHSSASDADRVAPGQPGADQPATRGNKDRSQSPARLAGLAPSIGPIVDTATPAAARSVEFADVIDIEIPAGAPAELTCAERTSVQAVPSTCPKESPSGDGEHAPPPRGVCEPSFTPSVGVPQGMHDSTVVYDIASEPDSDDKDPESWEVQGEYDLFDRANSQPRCRSGSAQP